MIKALIIEDEKPARDLLKTFLKKHPDIEVIGECADGFSGIKAISEQKPGLIFLDIQLPRINGFEILELLDFTPVVIFTTAHDEYAIKAFEQNAVDYLLKPFPQQRFDQAVEKARKRLTNLPDEQKLISGLKERETGEETINRVVVKKGSKIHIIPVEEIQYFEARDDYVMIYTKGQRFMKQMRMKTLEKKLPSEIFVRIHRSSILNINEIASIELYEKETYHALLKSGQDLKISKTGYQKLKEVLDM